jgi:hypothetical protein
MEHEMGRACSTWNEKCIQHFGKKICKEETAWKTLCMVWRLILEWILEEVEREWTEFVRLWIGISGRLSIKGGELLE